MEPVQHELSEPDRAPTEAAPRDRELLERFIERHDEQAFEDLVRSHGPLVLGVCRRILGHHQDAEEAFQATFLVLARKAAAVQPPEMVPNWLYGVACRTALKMRTANAKRQAKEIQLTVVSEPKAPQAGPWEEIAPLLDRELSRLPDKYRAAVVCCDLEGQSRSDAARKLGWPEGTLKVRLMQARAILAKRLARHGIVLSVGALAFVLAENAAPAAVPAALVASTAKAAGALVAVQALPAATIGTKATTMAKATLQSLLFGKAGVAATGAGVVVAAVMLASSMLKAKPPGPTDGVNLFAEVQQALADNARQLSPITVTCTTRTASRLPLAETLARLQMTGAARSDRLFEERPFRVAWQDRNFYLRNSLLAGEVGDLTTKSTTEITFDGQVIAVASVFDMPKGAPTLIKGANGKVTQKRNPNGAAVHSRTIKKDTVAKLLELQPGGFGDIIPYFSADVGLILSSDSDAVKSEGRVVEQKLRADSALLDLTSGGGKLISAEHVPLDGTPCVRIELEAENPPRRNALRTDRDKLRRDLKKSRETPKWQELVLSRLDAQAKLPATRRYIFFLDPELNYAVRRCEQRYAPDTLLSRVDCSQFELIPGRGLWLPRKVENEMHEYRTLPGTVFKESFLTQITQVSAFDSSRVPDEMFKLDETVPGTIIRDGTDPGSAKAKDGYVSYSVPARLEDLPQVIARARNGEDMLQFAGLPLVAEPRVDRYRGGALAAIVLCNVAMLGAGAAYLMRRRRSGSAL